MTLKYLADHPAAIATVAQWYFDQWGYEKEGNDLSKEIENAKLYLNPGSIPFIVLAMEGEEVLGLAQLKYREMRIYPEKEHWLGGVYVAAPHRGRGIAARIIAKITDRAKELGVKTLYLQTERLDGGLYARLGWQPIEQVRYDGHEVLVMERHL